MLRHQLPTYSPLTAGGLLAGIRSAGPAAADDLRARLAVRYGPRRTILCGSGTQALTLALRGARSAGEPPLVALPAYACYDLVSAAVGADARITFYDLDPGTLAPEPASLAAVCSLLPDAVVVAPLFGLPVPWDEVRDVVHAAGALLIEDAAQGLGGAWKGQALGSLGDVSVLSFGRGKGWTGGAGGALLVHAEDLAPPEPAVGPGGGIGLGAKVAAQWILGRPWTYWIPAGLPFLRLGETVYHPPIEPEDMPPLSAALALALEDPSWAEVEVRRSTARWFLERLAGAHRPDGLATVRVPEGATPGYLRLPVLVPGGMAGLPDPARARARGIMPGYPIPLPALPAARPRTVEEPATPGAVRLATEVVTLPTHSLVSDQDRERILALLGVSG